MKFCIYTAKMRTNIREHMFGNGGGNDIMEVWRIFFVYIMLVIVSETIMLAWYNRRKQKNRENLKKHCKCWEYFLEKYDKQKGFSDALYKNLVEDFNGKEFDKLEIEHANALISADLDTLPISTMIFGFWQLALTPLCKILIYMIFSGYFLQNELNAQVEIMTNILQLLIIALITVAALYPTLKLYKKEKYFLSITNNVLSK